MGHLANGLFAKETGIKVTHVPHEAWAADGASRRSPDQFSMPQVSGALAMIQAEARTLGVAASQRMPMARRSRLRESGVDHVSGTWCGVLARARRRAR